MFASPIRSQSDANGHSTSDTGLLIQDGYVIICLHKGTVSLSVRNQNVRYRIPVGQPATKSVALLQISLIVLWRRKPKSKQPIFNYISVYQGKTNHQRFSGRAAKYQAYTGRGRCSDYRTVRTWVPTIQIRGAAGHAGVCLIALHHYVT